MGRRWEGGDYSPPAGGLTPPGIGQAHQPPPQRIIAPGGAAGIVRARLVIISGPGNALLVYNGTPAAGNLVIAIAAQAGGDSFGNSWLAGITLGDLRTFTNYTWLDEFGDAFFFHNGVQVIGINPTTAAITITDPGSLRFLSGAAIEGTAANIAAEIVGLGAAQILQMVLSGPKLNVAGATDWVQLQFNSANDGATSGAALGLIYIDPAGQPHQFAFFDSNGLTALCSSMVAGQPGSSPLVSASWTQMTLLNGFTAGTNNTFTDAPSYSLLPISPYYGGSGTPKTVCFRGTLVVPAGGIGSAFAQLPAGFQPQAGPFSRVNGLTNNSGTQSGRIELHANGNLFLTGAFVAGSAVDLTGQTFI